jgi:hypothetical protein
MNSIQEVAMIQISEITIKGTNWIVLVYNKMKDTKEEKIPIIPKNIISM